MESTIRGLVLDSSVLVAAERAKLTTPEVLRNIRASADIGDAPIVISAMTVAELAHGIYRADSPERAQQRRQFVDELKAHIPVHPVTEATAEIIATRWWRAGGPTVFAATEFEYDYPYRNSNVAAEKRWDDKVGLTTLVQMVRATRSTVRTRSCTSSPRCLRSALSALHTSVS